MTAENCLGLQGECWKNPKYMVGDEDQEAAKGYCRLSCGSCLPMDGIPGEQILLWEVVMPTSLHASPMREWGAVRCMILNRS